MPEDLISLILAELRALFREYMIVFASVLPRFIGVAITLAIGWLLGRLLGKIVRYLVKASKIDEILGESPIGKRLMEAGYSMSNILDLITRIAVYLLSIGIAIKILNFPEALQTAQSIINLVFRLVSGTVVLVVGVLIVEKVIEIASKIVGEEEPLVRVSISAAHAALLGMVFLASLSQMGVDLTPLATFLTALAWGVGAGIGIAVVILSLATFKDPLIDLVETLSKRRKVVPKKKQVKEEEK